MKTWTPEIGMKIVVTNPLHYCIETLEPAGVVPGTIMAITRADHPDSYLAKRVTKGDHPPWAMCRQCAVPLKESENETI